MLTLSPSPPVKCPKSKNIMVLIFWPSPNSSLFCAYKSLTIFCPLFLGNPCLVHRITLFPYLPPVLFPVWWLFSKYFPSISCIVLCTRAVLPIIFSNTDLAEQRNVSNLAQLFSIYFAQETKFGLTYNLREIFQTNHSFTDFVKIGFCTYDDRLFAQTLLCFRFLISGRRQKNGFLAQRRPFLAQSWHFWPIWSHGWPKNDANKVPRWFSVTWVPKRLLPPVNIRIVSPKGQIWSKIWIFGHLGSNIGIFGPFRPMADHKTMRTR